MELLDCLHEGVCMLLVAIDIIQSNPEFWVLEFIFTWIPLLALVLWVQHHTQKAKERSK